MPTSSATDLYPSPCVPPQQESAARAQVRRDGSPGLRPRSRRARTTSWHVVLGRRCSVRDLVGRHPHVRVALATGVCDSQHTNAAFEIVVVRSMILCVRSLRKMLARKHVHIILERSRMVSNHLIYTVIFGPFAVQGVHRRFLARSFRIHEPTTLDRTYLGIDRPSKYWIKIFHLFGGP